MPAIVSRQNGKSERARFFLLSLNELLSPSEGPISMVRVQGKKRQKHLRNVKQPFPNDGRRGGFFWTTNRTVEHFSSLISIATNDQIHDLTLILQTHLQWGKTIAHAYVLLHLAGRSVAYCLHLLLRSLKLWNPEHCFTLNPRMMVICYHGNAISFALSLPLCRPN